MSKVHAPIAKAIADVFNNNYSGSVYNRELSDFVKKVVQVASIGSYEMLYKPDEPLLDGTIEAIKEMGYDIVEEGWKYKVNWR